MHLEWVDVGKRRVAHAGDGASVMQQLTHISAAAAHALEPGPCHQPLRIGHATEPGLDPGIAPDRVGEPQEIVFGDCIQLIGPRADARRECWMSASSRLSARYSVSLLSRMEALRSSFAMPSGAKCTA